MIRVRVQTYVFCKFAHQEWFVEFRWRWVASLFVVFVALCWRSPWSVTVAEIVE